MSDIQKSVMIVKIPKGGLSKPLWEKYRNEVYDLIVSKIGEQYTILVVPDDYDITVYN